MRTCRNCKTQYEDGMRFCPNCGSPKIITAEEIMEENQQAIEQEERERLIVSRHKKRTMWFALIAVVLVVSISVTVIAVRNADENRVIVVNGIEQPTKKEMADAYEMGVAYLAQGDLNNAITQLSLVDERSPEYKDAQVRLIEANAQNRDQQLSIASTYEQSGDYITALEKVDAVYQNTPNDSVVLAKREEILAAQAAQNAQSKSNALSQADERINQQDYSSAITILKAALTSMPDDVELQTALENATSQYKSDYLARINALITEGKNTDASALLQTALQIFPNDNEFLSKASTLQTSNLLGEATTKEMQGDLEGAIAVIQSAEATIGQNPTVIETLNRLEANFKQQVIANAKQIYDTNGYLEAAQAIQKGITVLPSDPELQTLKQDYLDMAPVDLLSLNDFDHGGSPTVQNAVQDNLGEDYEHALNFYHYSSSDDTYITYKVSAGYRKLTGVVFIGFNRRSHEKTRYIEIYGDDILLYTSPAMSKGVEPAEFSIDITGVDKIRISFSSASTYDCTINVGNLMLYK